MTAAERDATVKADCSHPAAARGVAPSSTALMSPSAPSEAVNDAVEPSDLARQARTSASSAGVMAPRHDRSGSGDAETPVA
jgi:hypothetical protein